MSADKAPDERVIVYRLGSLGDTVVALPCLHAVARSFPTAERIMLTNFPISSKAAPLEAILGGSGLLHRFMAYPLGTRSLAELRALRTALLALNAQTLVYLTPSRGLLVAWRDLLFFRLCGIKRIVGAPLTTDLQQNRRAADGSVERECERLVRNLSALGPIDLEDQRGWDLLLTPAENAVAADAVGPLMRQPRITINMGGKVAKNDWGEANWQALIARLCDAYSDHALVFVGAPEDAERSARIGALWPGPTVNLCGKVSPRVSAAAMSGSRVFIGHDSGPLHLAASTGVNCVSMFGDNNPPRKWHPMGAGHRILHDMRGVMAIQVETVVEAVRAVLANARTAPASPPVEASP